MIKGTGIVLMAVIWSILGTSFSFAQKKVWTLKECIDYAMENNVDVLSNEIDTEIAAVNEQQSKLNYIPAVSANIGYNINTGRALDPTTYQYTENQVVNNMNAAVGASSVLLAGLQKYHNVRKSQREHLAAIQDFQRFKNDMSLNIAMYYLEVLYNKELVVTLEKQVESSQENIDRMEKLVNAGTATVGELLDMEAQKANEEYSLVDGQSKLSISILNLCQLLEISDTENFDVEVPDIAQLADIFPKESVGEIYQIALRLPEIEAAKLRVESAEYDIKIAKAKLYPSLNFNFGYSSAFSDSRQMPVITSAGLQYQKYKFWDQIRDNAGTSISFGLSIPILNSFSARKGVKLAELSKRKAEYAVRNAELKLFKDVKQAHTDALGALSKFDAALKRVKANQESIKYMEEKFRLGTASVTDYNIARNNLLIAQSQMLQAKYDYIFKVKVLEFYKGIPIGLEPIR